jgi:outer membrane protein assembly factor BamB
VTVIALLSFSTIIPALAYAQPLANNGRDWQFVNGNSWGWNYSPQNQINKDNVDQIEVKWIFPMAGKSAGMEFIQNDVRGGGEGSTTPPIVRDGLVYVTTNYLRTYAIDASSGKQEWTYDYVIDIDEAHERLPIALGPRPHLHGFRYWEAGDAILNNGLACDMYGIDAKTGENSFWIQDLCKDIPGNLYKYYKYAGFAATSSLANIGTYDKGNLFIFVLPGSVHASVILGDARHVTLGIDMTTHEIEWRVFSYPPQNVPTQDWALQECDIGFFRDIPCSTVPTENLEWDWAQPGEVPSIFGGVTANWGQAIIDEDTGLLYTQTGNQGPFTYIGHTPGPRLYGSTIMAIDMDEGERVWWNQPMPRDPYDYDCNWGGILAEVSGLGKVYMKGCKEGLLQVLDAATGEPHYIVDVVDEMVGWGQITSAGLTEPYEGEGGVKYHLMDPLSFYDMREMESPDNSNYCGRPCDVFPGWSNGIFATDMSYDPETQTLFHYAATVQVKILESPASVNAGDSFSLTQWSPVRNSTIVARDAATGDVKWTWYYDLSMQRSHMAITEELLFTGFKEGQMRFFDKDTGTILKEISLGSDMPVGVTTGLDSNGDQKVFTIVGVGSNITPLVPGTVIALGLSGEAVQVSTTTVISTSTSRTTLTSTSTTTATVTSTSTSATTRTVTSTTTSATTSTVTSTGQASTTTVTSEVTEETGLPAEVATPHFF